jgi:hypothetical protein
MPSRAACDSAHHLANPVNAVGRCSKAASTSLTLEPWHGTTRTRLGHVARRRQRRELTAAAGLSRRSHRNSESSRARC